MNKILKFSILYVISIFFPNLSFGYVYGGFYWHEKQASYA
jgi:hypothetical protein